MDSQNAVVLSATKDSFIVSHNNGLIEVYVDSNGFSDGNTLSDIAVEVESERAKIIRERFASSLGSSSNNTGKSQSKSVKAPMPGMIKSVLVKPGDTVKKDSVILILEAMKMENSITAGTSGVVSKVLAEAGNSVDKNAVVCIIE